MPFPSPGDLPDPGIKPGSPTLQADTLTSEPPGKPQYDPAIPLLGTYMDKPTIQNGTCTAMFISWASLVTQMVKHLPAMREIQVQSLGWEDPLEKEMATHSSILAWKIPWTKDPGRLQSMGSQRVGHD